MSSFSADWLALREPADLRARSRDLAQGLALRWVGGRIVDLGAGTGANLRALAPLLPGPQHWCLVDHDTALLTVAAGRRVRDAGGGAVTIETRRLDLAAPGWEAALTGADLVTCSALLDLAGAALLGRLVEAVCRARAAFLAVLSVDGMDDLMPADPLDNAVLDAFHADMRRDKGLGAGLGITAPGLAARMFAEAGYRVATAPSDWRIAARDEPELARALIEGWAKVAAGRLDDAACAAWRRRREGEVAAGSLEIRVGHLDVLACPA
ncbi:class I SAM-dependent methyltransferase [Ancylobacter sp. 6x-1]|uniref:Class I SAM-dependent methyltransferase n=1 Tax=Ancylobacter crimeensis TaxID=2579147 RepID=A0ABT0DFD0_9HYPH|nr:class I SAM-dependent methyltransferase [Ancylobacter crimeensis]MCK0198652.1 class I SAM-dependent methyltransferase [Ancylobacter crimeensis]